MKKIGSETEIGQNMTDSEDEEGKSCLYLPAEELKW